LHEIPEKVWAIGIARPEATHHTPIKVSEREGLAPLTVVDADGERALPVFTTRDKAERGIVFFMTEEERADGPTATALVGFKDLIRTFRETPPGGLPKVDYIGVDMGEGGVYPLLRL
jgi:hypothetical protein